MNSYDNIYIALILIITLFVTGCTGTFSKTSVTRTIDQDALHKIAEQHSGLDLQLNRGDTIDISLKIESELFSIYVQYLKINVTGVDTNTISGEVINVHGQEGRNPHKKYKDITIMIKDIESITVYSTEYYTKNLEAKEYAEAFGWLFGLTIWISAL